ncbi:MAG: hypothetical protein FJW34_01870, partial [Acidobacteria bacterium]|nr:hypothetical protein [Acidobacteriota bacterium]
RYAEQGQDWAVDLNTAQLFDPVNHDLLMGGIAPVIRDTRGLRLRGRYLRRGAWFMAATSTMHSGRSKAVPWRYGFPAPSDLAASRQGRRVQPPDAENRTSGGVGGWPGAIPVTRPDRGGMVSAFARQHCRMTAMYRMTALGLGLVLMVAAQDRPLKLGLAEYEDRVRGAWLGQIIGTLAGFQFEGKVASSPLVLVDRYPKEYPAAPVDDDYYYELVALRAFEKYGLNLTLDELGRQWKENSAGTWGSSEQTRLALARGVPGSQAGHPRHNRLWWTIGPQFSADLYGMVAAGDPNLAGRLARAYGKINGHAEAVDGAVFVAGMVSLAFRETDSRRIVREAARLVDPASPCRQCLDLVISMAEQGRPAAEVFQAVEDRWHTEYPTVNNAVANGGLVAASVWFGGGDFLTTLNLAWRAADYSDADCNAANCGAVVGAMRGGRALPPQLVEPLGDRMQGAKLGNVELTPRVDERISDVVRRIVALGRRMLAANGSTVTGEAVTVPYRAIATQPPELFRLADLTKYWNPEWTLERAGFGGNPGPGIGGPRCARMTYLDGDTLATWPRDEIRGAVLRRRVKLGASPRLEMEVAADRGCGWRLEVFVNNTNVLGRLVEGAGGERSWQKVALDLAAFSGQEVEIRVYQRTLLADRVAGNAYWRGVRVE